MPGSNVKEVIGHGIEPKYLSQGLMFYYLSVNLLLSQYSSWIHSIIFYRVSQFHCQQDPARVVLSSRLLYIKKLRRRADITYSDSQKLGNHGSKIPTQFCTTSRRISLLPIKAADFEELGIIKKMVTG